MIREQKIKALTKLIRKEAIENGVTNFPGIAEAIIDAGWVKPVPDAERKLPDEIPEYCVINMLPGRGYPKCIESLRLPVKDLVIPEITSAPPGLTLQEAIYYLAGASAQYKQFEQIALSGETHDEATKQAHDSWFILEAEEWAQENGYVKLAENQDMPEFDHRLGRSDGYSVQHDMVEHSWRKVILPDAQKEEEV